MTSKKARWDEVDEGRTAGKIIKMKVFQDARTAISMIGYAIATA